MPLEITIRPGKPPKKGPKLSKKKEKELQDLIDDMGKQFPITGKTKKKKKKGKYSGDIPARKEVPANPHGITKKDQEGNTILMAKDRGSASKFPDLSGDGKVTQKDILMGRGVVKAAKGGLAGRLAKRGYGKARK